METLLETEDFVLTKTGRDYDFTHTIVNKNKKPIYFAITTTGDFFEVSDWVGFFNDLEDQTKIEEILKGNYEIGKGKN